MIMEEYQNLQEQYLKTQEKKEQYLAWVDKHWKIVGGKAYYKSEDLEVEAYIEEDLDGFEALVVDADSNKTWAHGCYTTVNVPLEVINELIKCKTDLKD